MTANPNNVLERRPDESLLQYHRRLVDGKLVDKTLADYDYSELAEYVYGKRYAPDVARRMMYGSRQTLSLLDDEVVGSAGDNMATDIETKIRELKKERQRFYDQRREYNKLVNEDGRMEHLFDTLAKAADELSYTVGDLFDEFGGHRHPVLSVGENEAILVFSDWHYGLKVDNVFNHYDTDVCKARVAHVVALAKERIALNQCNTLHIVMLGDAIHGSTHIGTRVASNELTCDQLMQASEIFAQAIIELSASVNRTLVYTTYGNHARTIQNKKDSIHRDNMERIIPWWIEQRIQAVEKNTGFDLGIEIVKDNGDEFLFINACGHDFCASHGDLDSVASSPRLLATLFYKKYRKDIEYILLGDKHHRESFNELGVTSMVCGSLCGTDQYASDKRLYSTPSQLLLIVNKDNGVDAEYRLKCESI